MSANVFVIAKQNKMLIEPFKKCTNRLNTIIRESDNMKWERQPKRVRGELINKFYIVATFKNEEEFNDILDILDVELKEDYFFDGHDYYDGYKEVELWIKNRNNLQGR